MASIEQLETWIAEAEAKRHEVMSGGATLEITHGTRRWKKYLANLSDLNSYIADLQRQLEQAQTDAGQTRVRRRFPIGVRYQ